VSARHRRGLATRKLYTDAEEAIFDVRRPVIVNGIADNVTRSDLLDRRVAIHLPPIPKDRRRPERELWEAFSAEAPKILGRSSTRSPGCCESCRR